MQRYNYKVVLFPSLKSGDFQKPSTRRKHFNVMARMLRLSSNWYSIKFQKKRVNIKNYNVILPLFLERSQTNSLVIIYAVKFISN